MDWFNQAIEIFLHLDKHLEKYAEILGWWIYPILFAIIFCETGLVVTPILPGDSLLFAAGALAGNPRFNFEIGLFLGLLMLAAITGDALNYSVGNYVGPKVFKFESSRFFNKKHLMKTHEFYEKYGGKTIIIARFIPIIRTFAPFVAGIARMGYSRFALYNVTGGILWIALFLLGGYFFGRMQFVQDNFSVIVLAIIIISVMPMVIELFLAWRRQAVTEPVPAEKTN
ncbi:MAG TPA: DedA family protein [Gemmataceae bacterium]|nr:DedA family protein [Gemmataceae bacterium]